MVLEIPLAIHYSILSIGDSRDMEVIREMDPIALLREQIGIETLDRPSDG